MKLLLLRSFSMTELEHNSIKYIEKVENTGVCRNKDNFSRNQHVSINEVYTAVNTFLFLHDISFKI